MRAILFCLIVASGLCEINAGELTAENEKIPLRIATVKVRVVIAALVKEEINALNSEKAAMLARDAQEEAEFKSLRERIPDLTPAEKVKLNEYSARLKICIFDPSRQTFSERETIIYGKAFLAMQHEVELYSKANRLDLVINDDQSPDCPTSLASVTAENAVSLTNRHVLQSASQVDITNDILQRLKSQH